MRVNCLVGPPSVPIGFVPIQWQPNEPKSADKPIPCLRQCHWPQCVDIWGRKASPWQCMFSTAQEDHNNNNDNMSSVFARIRAEREAKRVAALALQSNQPSAPLPSATLAPAPVPVSAPAVVATPTAAPVPTPPVVPLTVTTPARVEDEIPLTPCDTRSAWGSRILEQAPTVVPVARPVSAAHARATALLQNKTATAPRLFTGTKRPASAPRRPDLVAKRLHAVPAANAPAPIAQPTAAPETIPTVEPLVADGKEPKHSETVANDRGHEGEGSSQEVDWPPVPTSFHPLRPSTVARTTATVVDAFASMLPSGDSGTTPDEIPTVVEVRHEPVALVVPSPAQHQASTMVDLTQEETPTEPLRMVAVKTEPLPLPESPGDAHLMAQLAQQQALVSRILAAVYACPHPDVHASVSRALAEPIVSPSRHSLGDAPIAFTRPDVVRLHITVDNKARTGTSLAKEQRRKALGVRRPSPQRRHHHLSVPLSQ